MAEVHVVHLLFVFEGARAS